MRIKDFKRILRTLFNQFYIPETYRDLDKSLSFKKYKSAAENKQHSKACLNGERLSKCSKCKAIELYIRLGGHYKDLNIK